jgi:hypothetical protein
MLKHFEQKKHCDLESKSKSGCLKTVVLTSLLISHRARKKGKTVAQSHLDSEEVFTLRNGDANTHQLSDDLDTWFNNV